MIDRNVGYCVYFVSFRDDDAVITRDIQQMIQAIQAQNLQLFSIKLGPIDRDTANSMVSRILVSFDPSVHILLLLEVMKYLLFLLSPSSYSACRQA